MELTNKDITEQIIGAAFEVYNVLGYGFLEKVYQRAVQVELRKRGLKAEVEPPIKIHYKSTLVGEYRGDILVADRVLVELKAAKEYNLRDEPQLLNVLKAGQVKTGLLINFGRTKVEFKRMVF